MLLYNGSTNGYFYISEDEDDRSKSWGEVELRWVKQITLDMLNDVSDFLIKAQFCVIECL